MNLLNECMKFQKKLCNNGPKIQKYFCNDCLKILKEFCNYSLMKFSQAETCCHYFKQNNFVVFDGNLTNYFQVK